MILPTEQAEFVLAKAQKIISSDEPAPKRLARLWRSLMLIEASSVASAIRNTIGDHVFSGPFKGMRLTPDIMTRTYAPILLGTYEHELYNVVEAIIAQPYQTLLNIGCGFGYYSVGLARRMPQVKVLGFDIDPNEQKRTQDLAALNNVQDRVTVGGLFEGENFAAYAGQKTMLIMDIEGGEEDLLDPARYPALQKIDILVELHDVFGKSLSKIVPERFAATHDIQMIYNKACLFDLTALVEPNAYIQPDHSMLATWEHRDGPTPWAIMRVKSIS